VNITAELARWDILGRQSGMSRPKHFRTSEPTRWRSAATILFGALMLLAMFPARAAAAATDSDIPPAGRSLFDILTTVETEDGPRLNVPYPFEALRALITEAGNLTPDDLSETVFPLGRSLQREVAAPDYFKSPRLVLGVTGEPRQDAPETTLPLKDRLYIGYQPRADALEVISFNETAGRFEFQVVENYARGETPKVFQAQRSLCLSCHQNAGPIFPNAPWSETPANPRIAARLAKAAGQAPPAPEAHEVALRSVKALHRSVDNANRLAHAARYWEALCTPPNTAEYCKVGLMSTTLAHRLSGRRSHGQGDFLARREAETFLSELQRFAWPNGFEVAAPFISDIDPLRMETQESRSPDNALASRPAQEMLNVDDPGANNRIIDLLGGVFTAGDIRWLDDALLRIANSVGAKRGVARAPCEITRRPAGANAPGLEFVCDSRVPGFPTMKGRLHQGNQNEAGMVVDELRVQLLTYRDLAGVDQEFSGDVSTKGSVKFRPVDPITGLRPRAGDSRTIASVKLDWDIETEARGQATFTIVDDIARFRITMGTLTGFKPPSAEKSVTEGGLRRRDIMRALAIRLGQAAPDWCCGPHPELPPPVAVVPTRPTIAGLSTEPGPAHPSLQAFHRVCGVCHAGPASMPPNFLFGSSERQIDAISNCAPRILARLELWEIEAADPPPMPPHARLSHFGLTPEQWLASSDFRRIQRFARRFVEDRGPILDYRALPSCEPGAKQK
jgi:hypothetical protein